jgi:hypothetical protein
MIACRRSAPVGLGLNAPSLLHQEPGPAPADPGSRVEWR